MGCGGVREKGLLAQGLLPRWERRKAEPFSCTKAFFLQVTKCPSFSRFLKGVKEDLKKKKIHVLALTFFIKNELTFPLPKCQNFLAKLLLSEPGERQKMPHFTQGISPFQLPGIKFTAG